MKTQDQTRPINSYSALIEANPTRVWKALTDPAEVKQYFFGTDQQSEWSVGKPITWTGEFEGKAYIDKGIITECEPGKIVEYTYLSSWSGLEDLPENYLLVRYVLEPKDNNTILTILFSSYDAEKAEHSASGWASIIDGLKKTIELNP